MELNAIVLLAELYNVIKEALHLQKAEFFGWSDSTIALSWIKAEPSKYEIFVANRISKVQSLTNKDSWYHVESKENAADVASRGCSPDELLTHQLWWYGPQWLKLDRSFWPNHQINETTDTGLKIHSTTKHIKEFNLFNKYSSYMKLVRVHAYVRRFINQAKSPQKIQISLSGKEISDAINNLTKLAQQEMFPEEIKLLQEKKQLTKNSSILSLTPFIDDNGLIRVRGRLQNANLSYSQKHPIILKGNHAFSKLLIQYTHLKTLHGGNQVTLAYLRQKYWITKAKQIIKSTIRKCTTCIRFKGETLSQIMGNLPAHRVQPSKPFYSTSLDFFGPIKVRLSKGRGVKVEKAYGCIFICNSTKCTHIEAVPSLTSEDFINAFKRFTARKGWCTHVFCDNGTNFVGADKILQKEYMLAIKQSTEDAAKILANDQVTFHFNIPIAPHMNGLAESTVKSIKHHLKRIIKDYSFTFDEISTLLAEIEAILNSRPLMRITEDIGETILTPAKLLLGSDLSITPEEQLDGEKIYESDRYKLMRKLKQQFWNVWEKDYLNILQTRNKWHLPSENLKEGQIVLLKDELCPPAKWPMAVVEKVHMGPDGKIRSADVKTATNTFKRPVVKLILLPGEDQVNTLEENGDNSKIANNNKKLDTETHENISNRTRSKNKINVHYTSMSSISKMQDSAHNMKKYYKFKIHHILILVAYILANLITTSNGILINGTGYSIMSFDQTQQSGILFEDVGTANLITNSWKLITYVDLTTYWTDFKVIETHLISAEDFCTGVMNPSFVCQTTLKRMKQTVANIKTQNSMFDRLDSALPRQKRQINWGNVANTVMDATGHLIGLLSKDQAKNYDSEIESMRFNQARLTKLIDEKISIADSTLNVLSQTMQNSKSEVQQLSTLNKYMENELDKLTKEHHLFSIMTHLSLIISEYQNTQEMLLDILLSAYNGNIHTAVMPIDQLQKELIHIRGHLPSLNKLPAQLNEDGLLQYLKNIKTSARIFNQKLILELKIPLLYSSEFQLFKLVSVLTKVDDSSMAYINPTSEYLLVTMERDKYYPLTQEEFTQCKKIDSSNFWCSTHHLIYTASSSYKSCEIKLLQHVQQLPSTCKIKKFAASNSFTKMYNHNTWTFSVPAPRSVDIICGSLQTIQLEGNGLIKLKPGCILRDTELTLIGRTVQKNTTFESTIIPFMNLKDQLKYHQYSVGTSLLIEENYQPQNCSHIWIWVIISIIIVVNICCIVIFILYIKRNNCCTIVKNSTIESNQDI